MVQGLIMSAIHNVLVAEDDVQKNHTYVKTVATLLANLLVLVLLALIGSNIWNDVVKRLVPSVGKAGWYDIAVLQLLLGALLPCAC
jgi:hypothetical protein